MIEFGFFLEKNTFDFKKILMSSETRMSDRASRRADVKARPVWSKGDLNSILIAPLLQMGHAQMMLLNGSKFLL